LGSLVLVQPSLVVSVDLSVLFLALPHLAEDRLPERTQQLWIVDICGFIRRGARPISDSHPKPSIISETHH
jgi:MFS transporter, DHA2 family, multidrug resistance protein